MVNELSIGYTTSEYVNSESIEHLFSEMVENYSQKIYQLAYRFVNNESDAEDILQETFLKVLKNIDSFKGESTLSTWIYRIATNEALMLLRKRKSSNDQLFADEEDDEDEDAPEIIDFCCLPEQSFLSEEFAVFLKGEVARLTDPLREVFILRDLEHNSIKETAELLNITEAAVKVRLLRARMKLREVISAHFSDTI